jgi:hypothetical protein
LSVGERFAANVLDRTERTLKESPLLRLVP